jgi:O-succinylbenzoic acid--CoA ligase
MGGLSVVLRCLAARKPVVLVTQRADESLDLNRIATAIVEQRVTLLSLVPTVLSRLLQLPGFELPRAVRAILLGGDAAPAALLRRALERGWPVFTTYGMTETAAQVTTQRYACGSGQDQGCGPALPGVQLKIDGTGNVCVRGPTLFSGYWLPPTLDPQRDEQGWFHTPDLGRIDEQGCLHLLGRSSDLLISGGENVHPLEVERVIETHPAVRRCCVFGVPDATWGQLVCALLEGPSEVDDSLRAHLREALLPHQRPRRIALVDALPETSAGKLDRDRARDLFTPRLIPLA